MSEPAMTPRAVSSNTRLPSRLRITAVVIVALGIAVAELIYWRGTRAAELPDDPSLLQNEKSIARQAGILYGNQAAVVQQWSDELKRPGVESLIVVTTAVIIGFGCLYLARLVENDAARQTINRSANRAD
jgi:hypothetical protein